MDIGRLVRKYVGKPMDRTVASLSGHYRLVRARAERLRKENERLSMEKDSLIKYNEMSLDAARKTIDGYEVQLAAQRII